MYHWQHAIAKKMASIRTWLRRLKCQCSTLCRNFCQQPEFSSVQEIHFVDPNADAIDAFQNELSSAYGSDVVTVPSLLTSVSARGASVRAASPPASRSVTSSYWQRGPTRKSLKTKEGITIDLVPGEIAKQKVSDIEDSSKKNTIASSHDYRL